MTDFAAVSLELAHIQFIVRALYDLAETDGVHQAELVMVRGFYEQCQEDAHALTSFDDLIGADFDGGRAAELFDSPELKATFLQSCVFLAYADGHYSAGERAKVRAYADALGVAAAELATIEESVGDHLLQQVSRIENTEALKKVAADIASSD